MRILAAVLLALAAATAAAPQWIERLFGIDPDHGSGTLEILLVVICIAAAIAVAHYHAARRSRAK